MDTAPILILAGPPGAGKTTTAGILAARAPRSAHLESDVFFRFLSSGYVEPWKPESRRQNDVVMRIVAAAAAGYAAGGYLTIVEGILIPGWYYEPLRDALREDGHDVSYAVLRAPLAVCAARVQEREGAAPIVPEAIEQLWHGFAGLGDLERNVLEPGDAGPEETAERLARSFEDGLLRV